MPTIAADAGVGGAWQVIHHEIENERIAELPDTAPQLIYLLLTPFIGPKQAAKVALEPPPEGEQVRGATTNGGSGRA